MTDQTKTAAQRHDDEFLCLHAAYLERRLKKERERFCGTGSQPHPGYMRAFIQVETEIFVELHRQNIGDPENLHAQ